MRKWVLIAVAMLIVAVSAYVIRANGIDLVALSGIGSLKPSTTQTSSAPQAQGDAQSAQRRTAPVELAKASSASLSDDVTAIGTLLARESVAIAPETSGRIAEILFEDGARVAAGAPLFKLDSDLANAALTEAKARMVLAEANYGRSQTLRKSGNLAQSSFDAALYELEVARAAVETAIVHLNKLTISAPFSGTLGFRTVSEGAYVNAGTTLVELDQVDRLQASFSVPELQQALIEVGQQVAVSADALPGQTFSATISAIDPSIDVNGRALQLRADLDNADGKLKPGLLVRLTIKGVTRQTVTVPESAIVQRGTESFIFVAEDKTASERKVRLGKRMPGIIEILEGVDAGAEVVVAGTTRLSNGAAIEVIASTTSTE